MTIRRNNIVKFKEEYIYAEWIKNTLFCVEYNSNIESKCWLDTIRKYKYKVGKGNNYIPNIMHKALEKVGFLCFRRKGIRSTVHKIVLSHDTFLNILHENKETKDITTILAGATYPIIWENRVMYLPVISIRHTKHNTYYVLDNVKKNVRSKFLYK